jgi:hypothetical protein
LVEVQVISIKDNLAQGVITAPCKNGFAIVSNIPEGFYRLSLEGIDANDKSIYEGFYPDPSIPQKDLEKYAMFVKSGQQSVVPEKINLTGKPGEILLSWYFENGRLCSMNGINTVDVTIYDMFANLIHDKTYSCDPSSSSLGLTNTENASGENTGDSLEKESTSTNSDGNTGAVRISSLPAGEVDVIVDAIGSTGDVKFQAKARVSISHGTQVTLEIPLKDCQTTFCN